MVTQSGRVSFCPVWWCSFYFTVWLVWFGWGEKTRQADFQSNRQNVCCPVLFLLLLMVWRKYLSRRRYWTYQSRGLLAPLSTCQLPLNSLLSTVICISLRLESRSEPSEVTHFPRKGVSEFQFGLEISLNMTTALFFLSLLFPPCFLLIHLSQPSSSPCILNSYEKVILWEQMVLLMAFQPSSLGVLWLLKNKLMKQESLTAREFREDAVQMLVMGPVT